MEFTEQELEKMNDAANDAAFIGGRYGSTPKQFAVTDTGIYAYGNDCRCARTYGKIFPCNHFTLEEREMIREVAQANRHVSNEELELLLDAEFKARKGI